MKAITLISMLLLLTAARAQMLPPDGSIIPVLELDAVIDDSSDDLCDLSRAVVIGQTEMTFKYYGDTLVRRAAAHRADWLRVCGDTIWSLGTDTRRANTRLRDGLPYLMPLRDATVSDSLRHCMFMSLDRDALTVFRYSSGKGRSFILPASDTIAATYCVETELYDTIGKMRHRRWYAEGAVWPVVEYVTVSVGEEESSILTVCLPSEQPRPMMYARGKDTRGPSGIFGMLASLHGSGPSSSMPPAQLGTISVADGVITIGATGSSNATVRLFDAAGRRWHEGSAASPIPTSHLPAGVYLLHVVSDTESFTTKISISDS